MNKNEQRIPRETERKVSSVRTDMPKRINPADAETMLSVRTNMLCSIEGRVSPLMRKALEIKIAHEKEDLDELIKTVADAEAERAKRKGVLDCRFFRKRSLPA